MCSYNNVVMSYMTRTLRHMSIRAIVMTVYIYICVYLFLVTSVQNGASVCGKPVCASAPFIVSFCGASFEVVPVFDNGPCPYL